MTKELRWTVAFFEWAERIQRYTDQNAKYSYVNEIIDFVNGGMTDDSFIDGVSRIVSLGCHRDGCGGNISVRDMQKRRDNFYMIINDIFQVSSILTLAPKPIPKITPQPTFRMNFNEGNENVLTGLTVPRPPIEPALSPSMEVLPNPLPGPYYVAPPIDNSKRETEMPTYEELLPLEQNAAIGLFQSIICLLFCVTLCYSIEYISW